VDRVTPSQPPFTSHDICQHRLFWSSSSTPLVKRYGVIFTCLAICAVHIEVAHSLETDSFLMTLRRFIARRCQVKEIRSHNSTNFTGGEREHRESINTWNQNKIHEALLQKSITWCFNPPHGSHYRGVWEQDIGTTRSFNLCFKLKPLTTKA